VSITGNTIGGNLEISKNTGGVSITGNTIGDNLTCKKNNPPPTGGGNIVHGNTEDQCAGLGGNPSTVPTDSPPTPTHTPPAPTQTATPPTPTALIANEDAYTLTGEQISVPAPGILANDQFSENGPVEVILVRAPQHGVLALGQEGDFVYQAQSGYFGEDSFDYLFRSAGSESNPASVRITMADQEAPTVQWVAPVLAAERYDIREGEQVILEVEASDNGNLSQVTFQRWDAVNERYIALANLAQPPFRVTVSASDLNPAWNQVFVKAMDAAGNSSERSHIWLYKVDEGGISRRVYLPFLGR
jgi:hypothetical protein